MKRHFLNLIVVVATLTTAFIACKDDKKDNPSNNIEVKNEDALTQNLYADQTEGQSITIITAGAWTSSITETTPDGSLGADSDSPAWISINPDHGNEAGTYTINITLSVNNTDADRTAKITVSCNGTDIFITITQKKGEAPAGTLPRIDMFYCEFVPAGGILRMKGDFFINPKVFFYGEDGETLIEGEVWWLKSSKEIYVKVPDNVGHSKPVIVQTNAGQTESKILFRDKRNIIIDFDRYPVTSRYSGTIDDSKEPDAEGRCTWLSEYDYLLPAGYVLPKGCDGIYGQINGKGYNRTDLMFYHTESDDTDNGISEISRVERFINDYDLNSLVIKFEVLVPKEYPINGVYATLAFAPKGNGWDNCHGRDLSDNYLAENIRIPGTWWVPFEPEISKSGDDEFLWKWKVGKEVKKAFYTDGWMTVTVPLSTFQWTTKGSNPIGVLNYLNGNGAGNPTCQTPLLKDRLWNFVIMWEPWAWGVCDQFGPFLCFFDNFRIVPEDGNGTLFGIAGGITRQY